MKYRPLGSSGINISSLGVGCSSYFGSPSFPENDALLILSRALDLGINHFDTGALYGNGFAERRLGKFLGGLAEKSSLIISTKAGTFRTAKNKVYFDFSPAAIESSFRQSQKNLGLETIPILYLHGPSVEDLRPELIESFRKLKHSGKIRFAGVNSNNPSVIIAALETKDIDVLMFDYNILCQSNSALAARAMQSGKAAIGSTPLAQNLYSNSLWTPRRRADLWYLARALLRHPRQLLAAQKYRFINSVPGYTGAEVALSFAYKEANFSSFVFGTTSMARLEQNIATVDRNLPNDIFERITSR